MRPLRTRENSDHCCCVGSNRHQYQQSIAYSSPTPKPKGLLIGAKSHSILFPRFLGFADLRQR
jgi:hypothetical protein